MSMNERKSFVYEVEKNYSSWTKQINDTFDVNEKAVADRINAVKKAVESGDYDVEIDNRLTRIEKAMK
jgi:anti-sigma28 factor (negative regulator of flagellin synthesis)